MLAKELRSFFEKQDVKKKLIDLDQAIQAKNFWNSREEAEKVLKKKKNYSTLLDSYNYFEKENKDLYDIFLLAKDENDNQIIEETLKKIKNLKYEIKKLEIKCFLSNENDTLNCYVEFHAGAGGTESQDWAEMLRRMYMKWALNKGYSVELISEHKGDEAGIKSSVIKISGDYIYGFLKSDNKFKLIKKSKNAKFRGFSMYLNSTACRRPTGNSAAPATSNHAVACLVASTINTCPSLAWPSGRRASWRETTSRSSCTEVIPP